MSSYLHMYVWLYSYARCKNHVCRSYQIFRYFGVDALRNITFQFGFICHTHRHTHTEANTHTKPTRVSSSDCCIQEKISLEIFHLARRQQLFPGLLHNLGDLDLHDLSVGAAFVALRWWLQTSPPGKRLNVITGVGKSRKAWRDADLRAAVAEMLEILGQGYMHAYKYWRFCW